MEQLNLYSVHGKVVITNTYDYPNNRMRVAAVTLPSPQPKPAHPLLPDIQINRKYKNTYKWLDGL